MLYYSEIRLTFEHICFQVCVVIFRVVRWRHDPRLKWRVLFFGLWPCVFFLDLGHCPAVLRRPGESRWLFVKNILNSSFIFIYFDDIYKTEDLSDLKKSKLYENRSNYITRDQCVHSMVQSVFAVRLIVGRFISDLVSLGLVIQPGTFQANHLRVVCFVSFRRGFLVFVFLSSVWWPHVRSF